GGVWPGCGVQSIHELAKRRTAETELKGRFGRFKLSGECAGAVVKFREGRTGGTKNSCLVARSEFVSAFRVRSLCVILSSQLSVSHGLCLCLVSSNFRTQVETRLRRAIAWPWLSKR